MVATSTAVAGTVIFAVVLICYWQWWRGDGICGNDGSSDITASALLLLLLLLALLVLLQDVAKALLLTILVVIAVTIANSAHTVGALPSLTVEDIDVDTQNHSHGAQNKPVLSPAPAVAPPPPRPSLRIHDLLKKKIRKVPTKEMWQG